MAAGLEAAPGWLAVTRCGDGVMSALLFMFLRAKGFPGPGKKSCHRFVGAETRQQRNLSC